MNWIRGVVCLCAFGSAGCKEPTRVRVMNCSSEPIEVTLRATGFEMTSKLREGEIDRKEFRPRNDEGISVDVHSLGGLHVQGKAGTCHRYLRAPRKS